MTLPITRQFLRAGATALILSTVTSVSMFVSADAVYAERGGNGNGNRGNSERSSNRSDNSSANRSSNGNANRSSNANSNRSSNGNAGVAVKSQQNRSENANGRGVLAETWPCHFLSEIIDIARSNQLIGTINARV